MDTPKKGLIGMAVIGALALGGLAGSLIRTGTVQAATTNTSSSTPSTSTDTSPPARDPHLGGHVANGITETLLTGDTATKVTAAAQAAVPGGTILRVETDAEGDAYEAHMTKADGTPITVKLDSSFKVTKTETGPGGQPHGQPAQQG